MSKSLIISNPSDAMIATLASLEELLQGILVQDVIQITCTDDRTAHLVELLLDETRGGHHGDAQIVVMQIETPALTDTLPGGVHP
ncbi:MAG: hypothetical protein C4575_12765 [Desulforudis sp.]|jgi:nitrogen regulatory protein PII|nr:MAG: hypothetical protein C4575_12765 [Desulforudis sp.]